MSSTTSRRSTIQTGGTRRWGSSALFSMKNRGDYLASGPNARTRFASSRSDLFTSTSTGWVLGHALNSTISMAPHNKVLYPRRKLKLKKTLA